MADKQKKSGSNKTINFAEKKKAYSQKHDSVDHKSLLNDNRVIKYDINKMREQINQQMKNKNAAASARTKTPAWVKLIYITILGMFIVLLGYRIYEVTVGNNASGDSRKFVSQSTELNTEDTIKYENIIDKKVNELIKSDDRVDVITSEIHRNGNTVYAFGYFTYPGESNKVYFDARINNLSVNSLVVNGTELIKK